MSAPYVSPAPQILPSPIFRASCGTDPSILTNSFFRGMGYATYGHPERSEQELLLDDFADIDEQQTESLSHYEHCVNLPPGVEQYEAPKCANDSSWHASAAASSDWRSEKDSIGQNLSDDQSTTDDDHSITTLMIRHIPCSITREELANAIDGIGFRDKYDVLHLPRAITRRTSSTKSNRGYAFVNFRMEQDAHAFALCFQGYRFDKSQSSKRCEVSLAHNQGASKTALPPPFVQAPADDTFMVVVSL